MVGRRRDLPASLKYKSREPKKNDKYLQWFFPLHSGVSPPTGISEDLFRKRQ